MIKDNEFRIRHILKNNAFTRKRKLPFSVMLILILQNTVKSLQIRLNEFFDKVQSHFLTATAQAFSQARAKLAHTAFIELNQKGIIEPLYSNPGYRTWQDFRLLAVDSVKVVLPYTKEIVDEFGESVITNQHENTCVKYAISNSSVMYDVLNHIGLDAVMDKYKTYDGDLLLAHLKNMNKSKLRRHDELVILDRGYPSYFSFATLLSQGWHFVARCSTGSFACAQQMFHGGPASQIVTLHAHSDERKRLRKAGLPLTIVVRFVRVILESGEQEVLATSLLDEQKYPTSIFKEVYGYRWRLETFYDLIKNRLNLENFSGKTVESVKQDFFSTIFITGLESILTADAQGQLDAQAINKDTATKSTLPKVVNKAVAFNAIKNHVFQLLEQEDDLDCLLAKLTQLFLTKPISIQAHRKRVYKKPPISRVVHHLKRKKKNCF